MPVSEQPMVERIARVLAGAALSSNADGSDPSAADKVDLGRAPHGGGTLRLAKGVMDADARFATEGRSSAEWIDALNQAGVPCGPIYKMDEVFADPQVKHLGIAQKVHHKQLGDIELIGQAVTLSRTPSRLVTASPDAGEHTDAILAEIGYSTGDIARLKEKGVV